MASVETIVKENDRKFEKEEKDFQNTYDIWINNDEPAIKKKAWDHMWILVKNACDACCKTKAYGIRVPDLEAKSLDACIKIMQNIRNGVRPGKLSSYVYLFCIGEIWKHKTIEWERSLSYNGLFDNYGADNIDGQYVLAEETPLNNNGYILDETEIVSKDNSWSSDYFITEDIAYVNEDDGTYNICSSEY